MYFNETQILKKKLFIVKVRRRKNKFRRRRGKHLESLFLSRKKRYSNYYQLFDSKIINKNESFKRIILKKIVWFVLAQTMKNVEKIKKYKKDYL